MSGEDGAFPHEQVVADLAATWNLTEELARRRWQRESECTPVPVTTAKNGTGTGSRSTRFPLFSIACRKGNVSTLRPTLRLGG